MNGKVPSYGTTSFIKIIFLENILRTIMKIISELSDYSQDKRARYIVTVSPLPTEKRFKRIFSQI